ncbi:MAG: CPBP family glutamic-type intramembrane protease [Myxococcota bacterium]|nr:CPBP family glutamic-type intramembrane protease [Myxococcota bacterium]MDW8362872.1 CPBP family glutamic-type intramembrane protease [Myxococcales bacterium]
MSRRRKLALFGVLLAAGAGATVLAFAASGADWGHPFARAVWVFYALPPAVAALAVQGMLAGEPVAAPLGLVLRPSPWWLVGWIGPLLLALGAFGVALVLPGVGPALEVDDFVARFAPALPATDRAAFEAEVRHGSSHPALRVVVQAMATGATFAAIRGLGVELALRGFLHHVVPGSPLRSAVVTGTIWATWLSPLVALGLDFPERRAAGLPLVLAWCLLASVLLVWLRVRSGSLVPVAIAHGTFESLRHLPDVFLRGGSELTTGRSGLAWIAVLSVAAAAVLGLEWRRMTTASTSRSPVVPPPAAGVAAPEGQRAR